MLLPLYQDRLQISEKFTACSKIPKLFTHPNGIVQIVVTTVAFRMGLDSPNVRTVIHWGPLEDLETYVQETGCGSYAFQCHSLL